VFQHHRTAFIFLAELPLFSLPQSPPKHEEPQPQEQEAEEDSGCGSLSFAAGGAACHSPQRRPSTLGILGRASSEGGGSDDDGSTCRSPGRRPPLQQLRAGAGGLGFAVLADEGKEEEEANGAEEEKEEEVCTSGGQASPALGGAFSFGAASPGQQQQPPLFGPAAAAAAAAPAHSRFGFVASSPRPPAPAAAASPVLSPQGQPGLFSFGAPLTVAELAPAASCDDDDEDDEPFFSAVASRATSAGMTAYASAQSLR
jgi:hypothetical protein